MNRHSLSRTTGLLVAVAMAGAALASGGTQQKTPKTQSSAMLKSALTSGTLPAYADKVNNLLDKTLTESSPEEVAGHLKRDTMRHALLQATFLNRCRDSEAFTKLTKTPQGRAFLLTFLSSSEYLEEFLDIVDCFMPASERKVRDIGAAFALSCEILSEERNRRDITIPALRRLAFAYGVLCRASHRVEKMEKNDPKAFYAFFRKEFYDNRLNPDFANYAAYEMIYIAMFWHDLESLKWLRENVNVPKRDMDGTCWRADYKLYNVFGYSIHGRDYYRPWEEAARPYSRMETIGAIGGVCGSLSTFGAMEAIAQGVPSLPIGQPGHCAYAIRMAPGNWIGGFGGPGGATSEQPLAPHGHESDFLFVIDEIYMDADTHRDSQNLVRAAQLIAHTGKPVAKRVALARLATEIQPNNLFAWDYLLDWLPDTAPSKEEAAAFGRQLGTGFAKRPAVGLRLAKRLTPLVQDGDDKRSLFAFYTPIMQAGADSWRDWQWKLFMDSLARDFNKLSELKLGFCRTVLNAYRKAEYFPEAIAWSQEQFKNDEGARKTLLDELIAAVSGGDSASPDVQRKTLAQLILMASSSGAMDAFQQFAKTAESAYGEREEKFLKAGEPWAQKVKPFPGECLSAGGIFKPTSSCNWDAPLLHARLLTPQLGYFHSGEDVKAGGDVTLTRLTEPSGIVVVAATGNNGRIPPLAVSVSEDGKAWEEVYKNDTYQDIYRIDLSDKPRRIRHVRVFRADDRKEFIHLRGILVYGRRLQ